MPFTVPELAKLCEAVYYKDLQKRRKWVAPGVSERVFDDGTIDTLTASGTGFHGGCFIKDDQAAIVFGGTNAKSGKDLAADIGMVCGKIPEQAKRAADLVQVYGGWAQSQDGVQSFILAGHSLGGALTQLVATAQSLPFVTFNAYGTAKLAKDGSSAIGQVAKWGADSAQGINVRDDKDPVSWMSKHIGKVVDVAFGSSVAGAHSMGALAENLEKKYAGALPFIDEPFN